MDFMRINRPFTSLFHHDTCMEARSRHINISTERLINEGLFSSRLNPVITSKAIVGLFIFGPNNMDSLAMLFKCSIKSSVQLPIGNSFPIERRKSRIEGISRVLSFVSIYHPVCQHPSPLSEWDDRKPKG
ncbi:hypothetical protein TNCV_1612591 [Trichonephila clavipes]|nr:hypothetical protein TNCV_1612591 [Trichonephila clavipes]